MEGGNRRGGEGKRKWKRWGKSNREREREGESVVNHHYMHHIFHGQSNFTMVGHVAAV